MSCINILLITHEIHPFIKKSPDAEFLRSLAAFLAQEKIVQLRIMAPCYGAINQRTGGLHEVIRLSGVNIGMGPEQYSLLVKVASLRKDKIQVYFITNEELFERKGTDLDQHGAFYPDNDTRALFFCKGVLSTIKRQEWKPDIIHAHGWVSSFLPLYLKTTYKNSLLFKQTKSIFTLYQDDFKHKFDRDMLIKRAKRRDLHPQHFDPMKEATYEGFMHLANTYADQVTHHFLPEAGSPKEQLLKELKSQYIDVSQHAGEGYFQLYQKLLSSA